MSRILPFSNLFRSTTSSPKIQINCYSFFCNFDCRKKKQKEQPAIRAWIQTQASGGPYEPEALRWVTGPIGYQPPYSDTPSRLVFPVDCRMVLMIPACCVQQDRFQITRHGRPSRLLDCDHPSGRESKTSTKRSARDSPPSLGMHDCSLHRSFRFQNGRFISSFWCWSRVF